MAPRRWGSGGEKGEERRREGGGKGKRGFLEASAAAKPTPSRGRFAYSLYLPGVRAPPGREPQRWSSSVDGPPPYGPRGLRPPSAGRLPGDRPEAPGASPRGRREARRARCGPVEPPARPSDPLRHPPREEEGRWGESLGGLPLRKKKTGRLRADAQRIVVTRLLYRVHDPTEQPSRMQGF